MRFTRGARRSGSFQVSTQSHALIDPGVVAAHDTRSPLTESYRSLATSLRFALSDKHFRALPLVKNLRTDGHPQHRVSACRTAPVLAHTVGPAFRFEMLLVTIIDQGVEAGDTFNHDIAATTAIAAIRSAKFDVLLTTKRYTTVATVTALEINLGLVEKLHDLLPYRPGKNRVHEKGEMASHLPFASSGD